MSIDIDGFDYRVWSSLERYRPTIVILEINSSIPPVPFSLSILVRPCQHEHRFAGSQIKAVAGAAREKSYVLVRLAATRLEVQWATGRRSRLRASAAATPGEVKPRTNVNSASSLRDGINAYPDMAISLSLRGVTALSSGRYIEGVDDHPGPGRGRVRVAGGPCHLYGH